MATGSTAQVILRSLGAKHNWQSQQSDDGEKVKQGTEEGLCAVDAGQDVRAIIEASP